MTDLLNGKLIAAHDKENMKQLVKNAKQEESAETLDERNIICARRDFLKKVAAFHDLVDKGSFTDILRGNRLSDDIFLLTGDITPYTNMERLVEVSLLPTHGTSRGEHALLTVYIAEHGAIAFVDGMRYITKEAFAASDVGHGGLGSATRTLTTFLVPSFTIGLHDFIVRSIPIFKPRDMEYEELRCSVRNWLHAFMPKNDGFIRWEDPDSYGIMELMRPGWWLKA